ncbi:MAG TPA: CDP-alcohol phosphatidyltransferase family protein [Patescibacteria group bacterium]|nr:CDP-alcohol phosphatidyltransferase family protein [Patescibacteria group bacterium]
MAGPIDVIRDGTRAGMRVVARALQRVTGNKLHPNMVTVFGLLMHIPIAILIALQHYNVLAAILLIIFGLFDTLDGELARLQHRESLLGGFLDASTDRMKETFLYTGIAYALALSHHPATAAWAAAACGASICVSYVKAKGEAIAASGAKKIPYTVLNKMFKDGLLTFEIRMAVLVVGLLFGQLVIAVAAIAILAGFTAVQRLVRIGEAFD